MNQQIFLPSSRISFKCVQQSDCEPPRIISFASKALSATERKYAQNQREALSAVWAVEHFAFFLLGRHFTLRTDAEGVTFILNRTRESSKRVLTRADGWALRLSPYDYDVEFVRGRDNIADPSSRLYVGNDAPFDDLHSPWEIASLEVNCTGFLTELEIKEATSRDQELLSIRLESGQTFNQKLPFPWTTSVASVSHLVRCVADNNGKDAHYF